MLTISGALAEDENGDVVGSDDPEAQARQCLKNIDTILRSVGATKDDIVRIGVFLTSMADRSAVDVPGSSTSAPIRRLRPWSRSRRSCCRSSRSRSRRRRSCDRAPGGNSNQPMTPEPAIASRVEAVDGKPAATYRYAGDSALLVEYGDDELRPLAELLRARRRRGAERPRDRGPGRVRPGFRSILVSYDPLVIAAGELVDACRRSISSSCGSAAS